jgi:trehalose 2-sulfotransferase
MKDCGSRPRIDAPCQSLCECRYKGFNLKAYVIAATPRSGSFYLSELLWNTGICGRPSEYVRIEDVELWQGLHGCKSYNEYLHFYLIQGWTRNGVFGAKLMWEQLVRLAEDLLCKDNLTDNKIADGISYAFDDCKYVVLRREDKLRQAISYYRALSTNKWHKTIEDLPEAHQPIEFDANRIDSLKADILAQEQRWQMYLSEVGAKYITVTYEDVQIKPEKCISTILDFLEIPGDRKLVPGQLLRQADAVTERWVQIYENSRVPGVKD